MEIQEFKDKKRKLENDIEREISRLIIHFRRETGYSPDNISIDLIDATTIGEENRAFIIGEVTTNVEI